MNLILTVLVAFMLLMSTEVLWRKGHVRKEYARKLVHVSVGTFVAFWPFFLDWTQIRLLSLAFVLVISLSLRLKIFKSIHSVERPSWGEVLFAVSVGAITFLTSNPYVYAVAILHMSVADGAAALIGGRFGKSNAYRVFGQYKSLAGSVAFLAVSLIILFWYQTNAAQTLPVLYLCSIAIVATALENGGWKGFDNLSVPVVVALLLQIARAYP